MIEIIQVNLSTIIVSLVLLVVTVRIIRKQLKDRKNGRSACSSCHGCSAAPLCTSNNKSLENDSKIRLNSLDKANR